MSRSSLTAASYLRSAAIAAVGLFAAFAAAAEGPSLFGIKVGSRIDSLISCDSEEGKGKICLESGADEAEYRFVSLRPQSPPGMKSAVTLAVAQGKIKSVSLETTGVGSQDEWLKRLTSYYGKPSSLNRVPLQNAFGLTVYAIQAAWDFKSGGAVQFKGVDGQLDAGYILATP